MAETDRFAMDLLHWFDQHGRHQLPWQHPRSAYRVWVSEIMLQQTQVSTVLGYFQRFMNAFPELADLAAASEDQVLAQWSGLGYYSRARNMRRAAQICVSEHQGQVPQNLEALMALPGIGRSTAGAILAQAWGQPVPILDGNVKRVLSRYHAVRGWPGESAIERRLWEHAEQHMPQQRAADYTQAIMDLGAGVCKRSQPRCSECPLSSSCLALAGGLVAELPTRKSRRPLPERERVMLLLHNTAGQVLLTRRDGPGVWAGLWSLPEFAERDQAMQDARRHGAVDLQEHSRFRHSFSHYHLQAQVLAACISAAQVREETPDQQWFDQQALDAVGLPAPVRSLLLSTFTNNPQERDQ